MVYKHVDTSFIDQRTPEETLASGVDKESAQFSLRAFAEIFYRAGQCTEQEKLPAYKNGVSGPDYKEISQSFFRALYILESHQWDIKAIFETAISPDRDIAGQKYTDYPLSDYTEEEIKALGERQKDWQHRIDFLMGHACENFRSDVDRSRKKQKLKSTEDGRLYRFGKEYPLIDEVLSRKPEV